MASQVSPTLQIDDAIRELIRLAVREDLGTGDRTVTLAISAEARCRAKIVSRREGIISGGVLLDTILREYSPGISCNILKPDSAEANAGDTVATLDGNARQLLSAERVLLNFLSHLSGIATLTRRYVDAIAKTTSAALICDTRKTIPAFRTLDKYAVRCGGGTNHRMGLYDGVMLKDNHLAALRERLGHGSTLAELTRRIRAELPPQITLWLEVDTLQQLEDALGGGAEIILLDNFSVEELQSAVALRKKRSAKELFEASGGITLANVAAVAQTGVDRIAIGALTHSAPVLDLSMELES